MSQLICPLCGKFTSVRFYDPEDFEDDIKRVQVRSLGRGKGTERAWTVSIFEVEDDPIFLKLRDRIAKLHSLFFDDELEELQKSVEENIDEVEAWRAESEELIARVNDAFNSEYEELEDAVDFLLEVALE